MGGVTLEHFERSLREAGVRSVRVELAGGCVAIVTEHWGKVFGPFRQGESPSIWMNPKTADTRGMRELLAAGEWCVGGDRIWLAPEVQFNLRDRVNWDSSGAYVLPREIDPGRYRIVVADGGCVRLEQTVTLRLYNVASGEKCVRMARTIRPARDPLRATRRYDELRDRTEFTGYSQEVELEDMSGGQAGVEAWNLVQLDPGGTVIVPTTGTPEFQDYYEPIDAGHFRTGKKAAFLRFTGDRKYKIGMKAPYVWGRIGYHTQLATGRSRLVIITFFSNPSSPYIDEPSGKPGAQGDALQFYNDDGSLGGFSEIEVHGLSVGGPSGRRTTVDPIEFWQYQGAEDCIGEIAEVLLGTKELTF